MAENEKKGKKLELFSGLILALFAGVLAISQLVGDKFKEDMMTSLNESTSAFNWYSSKSIKEGLSEGQRDLVKTLIQTGVIPRDKQDSVNEFLNKLEKKINKYSKEKLEILKGSAFMAKAPKEISIQDFEEKVLKKIENPKQKNLLISLYVKDTAKKAYILKSDLKKRQQKRLDKIFLSINYNCWQDINGELGKIVGADVWKDRAESANNVNDTYDMASFFIQLALILGAISLVIERQKLKLTFFIIMCALNAAGAIYFIIALSRGVAHNALF